MIDSMKAMPSIDWKAALYLIVSSLLLFLSFFSNTWQVADQPWFKGQNYAMESFIIGRMVKSRQDGFFSAGGLTGVGGPDAAVPEFGGELWEFQRQAYQDGLEFGSFSTYNSQIGGQGILFSILDSLMPLSSQVKLQLFHAFTSMLSAVTLSMIVLWFYWEIGFLPSLFALASAVLSPWLVVFGGKLWWSLWSFYLPVVGVMVYLRSRKPADHHPVQFGRLVFIAVFVKCLFTGYEYMTTTLIMAVVPLVYYALRDRWSRRDLIVGLLTAIFSSSLAILLSLAILCLQIASVRGSLLHGIGHIRYALMKRTHADPRDFAGYAVSLKASVASVVVTYLEGTFLDLGNYMRTLGQFASRLILRIRYLDLIVLFGIVSVFSFALRKGPPNEDKPHRDLALLLATWFSLLAPLSWFVIFKAHSYIHPHMNFIVWHMPFTLFGFALCGLVFQRTLGRGFRWIADRAS